MAPKERVNPKGIYFDDSDLDLVRIIALVQKRTVSSIIREAVDLYLKDYISSLQGRSDLQELPTRIINQFEKASQNVQISGGSSTG